MYRSIEEKKDSQRFNYHLVSSIAELLGLLGKYKSAGYCFRGQQDACWNVVSYAQRAWGDMRDRDCAVAGIKYQNYLSVSLEYAIRNVDFPKIGSENRPNGLRDHERWGFLQHYSWPTPFIDFTDNWLVALFMAVRGLPCDCGDGYFSIYAIRPEFTDGDENIDLDEWVRDYGGGDEELYSFHKWGDLHSWIMHKNHASWRPEISQGRMASQGGLFVYLNSADGSLEEEFAQKKEFERGVKDRIGGLLHDEIVCIDVPYSIVSQIKSYLSENGICAESLGLDEQCRDEETNAHYQKFEKFFLAECTRFLSRMYSRNKDTYFRIWKDDFMAFCPRSEASVLVSGGAPIEAELQNKPMSGEALISSIAARCDCSFGSALEWFGTILQSMEEEGLVQVDGGRTTEVVIGKEDSQSSVIDADAIHENAVKKFYDMHGLPTELHIDLTDACTERCVHCYVPKEQKNFLPVEFVEKALGEFRAMNGLTVHLTGGEAMMHPDFERICRKCVELDLNFIIFSNMTLCDEKQIAFLKEVQPQFVNVSLYSMDPTVHDAITQLPGSWRRTHDAVVKCCEAGVACRIATPLLTENQDALPALREFADAHRLHLVPGADIIAQSDHVCDNLAHACSIGELRRVLKRDADLYYKVYYGVMPACDAKVCDIGSARLYLNAKGNYYPCDSMHEYVLGNVRENTVEEIWKGEKLNYLRGLKNKDFGSCATCANRPWCKVCPASNFNATGDLFKHHPSTCALAGVVREVYGNSSQDGSSSSMK